MAFEQKPTPKTKAKPGMAQVKIQRTGDTMADDSMIALYEDLGYQLATTSSTGRMLTMEIPTEQALALQKDAEARHWVRHKSRAHVGSDVHLIKDEVKELKPMTAEQLLGSVEGDLD